MINYQFPSRVRCSCSNNDKFVYENLLLKCSNCVSKFEIDLGTLSKDSPQEDMELAISLFGSEVVSEILEDSEKPSGTLTVAAVFDTQIKFKLTGNNHA